MMCIGTDVQREEKGFFCFTAVEQESSKQGPYFQAPLR